MKIEDRVFYPLRRGHTDLNLIELLKNNQQPKKDEKIFNNQISIDSEWMFSSQNEYWENFMLPCNSNINILEEKKLIKIKNELPQMQFKG